MISHRAASFHKHGRVAQWPGGGGGGGGGSRPTVQMSASWQPTQCLLAEVLLIVLQMGWPCSLAAQAARRFSYKLLGARYLPCLHAQPLSVSFTVRCAPLTTTKGMAFAGVEGLLMESPSIILGWFVCRLWPALGCSAIDGDTICSGWTGTVGMSW